MHILCVFFEYAPPDAPTNTRAHTLLQRLSRQHRVTLITSDYWFRHRHAGDTPQGNTIERHVLPIPYENEMTAWQRLRAYLEFPLRAWFRARRLPAPDLVWAISTPLTTGWAAARLAAHWEVPWVLELRDLWPDFPIQMGALPGSILPSLAYAMEHALYRSAAHVITTSPDMTTHVRQIVPADTVTTLLHGSDLTPPSPDAVHALRQRHRLGDRHLLLYAGTFGRANAIPTLIDAAHRLQHRADLCFGFMGQGFYEPELRRAAASLPNVRLFPAQPQQAMAPWFALADLTLVPFIDRPVLATNSPAKFFDSLSVGTPVLVTNPGWTRRFVDTHRCGWYVPPEDPGALAEQIETLFAAPACLKEAGRRGTVIAQQLFDRARMADDLDHIFLDVVRRHRP